MGLHTWLKEDVRNIVAGLASAVMLQKPDTPEARAYQAAQFAMLGAVAVALGVDDAAAVIRRERAQIIDAPGGGR